MNDSVDWQNIYGWMDDNTCKFTSYMHKKKHKNRKQISGNNKGTKKCKQKHTINKLPRLPNHRRQETIFKNLRQAYRTQNIIQK